MKKRFISFLLALIFIFSGVFSCIASADDSIAHKLFDIWKRHNGFSQFVDIYQDLFQGGKETFDVISDFLNDSGEASQTHSESSDGSVSIQFRNTDYDDIGVSVGFSAEMKAQCPYDLDNALAFCWCAEGTTFNSPNPYDSPMSIYYHCVSKSDAEFIVYSYNSDTQYFTIAATKSIRSFYIRDDIKLRQDSNGGWYVVHNYMWGGYKTDSSIWRGSLPQTGQPATYDSRTHSQCNYMVYSDFAYHELKWSGAIDFETYEDVYGTPTYINFELTTDRDVVPEVDGNFNVALGIMFQDGDKRTFAGEYVSFSSFSGHLLESTYCFDDFCLYVYRKHCFHHGYIAFITVSAASDDTIVYSCEMPFELEQPGGIFDDVEDPPKWKEYEPDPSDPPEPPDFDSDVIFNFNTSNTTYQSFTWTTINNYNIGGSGGSGGGSSGDDSSSSGDDSSSGTDDPGGDSSSGSEPGGDGDQSFNEWFSDAVVTINNNFNNGLDTLNENVRIIKENTENYFTAMHDYLNDYLRSWIEYIAALLENFKDDFNAWTSAFGDFLSDNFKTINTNIAIVGDNIVKAIKNQVVPDKDVLYDIASTNFPVVDQINSSFSDFEVENKSLIVSIPLFGSDAEPSAVFVKQSQNSAGQFRGGVDNSDNSLSLPINDVPGDCLTFNLTEIFTQYDIPRFRSVGTLFILGSTLWSLINITFKIFGLGFFGDVQSSGRKLE